VDQSRHVSTPCQSAGRARRAAEGPPAADGIAPPRKVLAALSAKQCDPTSRGGDRHEAHCPAHRGGRKNLSVSEAADGTVLLKCHHVNESGRACAAEEEEIVEALGLTLRDLFPTAPRAKPGPKAARAARGPASAAKPKPGGKSGGRGWDGSKLALEWQARKLGGVLAGHWVYEWADGRAAAAVGRIDLAGGKKTYRPVHLERQDGRWHIGDPPESWPLFRLPAIVTAAVVYLVEGEKCVTIAEGIGLPATTTAHGAESAHKSDLSPLAGKMVVLMPDFDRAGDGYVERFMPLLVALDPPPRVKVLKLPGLAEPGDDIEQFVEARSGLDAREIRAEVERLAEALPWRSPAEGRGPDGPPLRVVGHDGRGDGDGDEPSNEHDDDPHRLARLFVRQNFIHADGPTLVFHRGQFYEWAADESLVARICCPMRTLAVEMSGNVTA
jgi:putative DNA primase/helicase